MKIVLMLCFINHNHKISLISSSAYYCHEINATTSKVKVNQTNFLFLETYYAALLFIQPFST